MTLCTRNFSDVLKCRFYFEKSFSLDKILLIYTPTEEFFQYLKIECIYHFCILLQKEFFLELEMLSLDKEIYFKRTSIFPINGKGKESFLHWFNLKDVIKSLFIKIAMNAVDLARILLPRRVLSISFWEQCSRAPPLFPPLSVAAM